MPELFPLGLFLWAYFCGSLYGLSRTTAPELKDTVANRLNEVVIEGKSELMTDQGLRYTPDRKQKSAAMTGADLINRMGIPQLSVNMATESISSTDGGQIAIFINKVPASNEELRAMRPEDVKYIEVLDNPSDPKFMGQRRVVNFVMLQYQYGGYIKINPKGTLITDEGSIRANMKLKFKAMTFDLMGIGSYDESNHTYTTLSESLSFPSNYPVNSFVAESGVSKAKKKDRNGTISFRALYSSDKISANSTLSAKIDRQPIARYSGDVSYTPSVLPGSNYSSESDYIKRYISYSGNYFFSLPKGNSLNMMLQSVVSNTSQNSSYAESSISSIINGAKDVSSDLRGVVYYSHSFSPYSSLGVTLSTIYSFNNTSYNGSTLADDRSHSFFLLGGASYYFRRGKWDANIGMGWTRTLSRLNARHVISYGPYADLNVNFRIDNKQKISAEGHLSVWTPPANQKSDIIIYSRPFLWITGNPDLKQYGALDLALRYSLMLSKKISFSSYISLMGLNRRCAYDYIPYDDEEGLLRTIIQPAGKYINQKMGATLTLRLLERSLMLKGSITENHIHDNGPAGWNHTFFNYSIQAFYYLGKFSFGLYYQSPNEFSDNHMSSGLKKTKSTWNFNIGWSKGGFNVRLTAYDLTRWNWESGSLKMSSKYYSYHQGIYGDTRHASIELTASYFIDFGKKVKKGNELNDTDLHTSGILAWQP